MVRAVTNSDQLSMLISKLIFLTRDGTLHWYRQAGSAHRYARWNDNLLILGPDSPLSDKLVPRYLFVTPFDSPTHIEINSNDEELGQAVRELVTTTESATKDELPTDPFALDKDFLSLLTDRG